MSKLYNTSGKELIDCIFPVGAIYISVNSTNPSSLFGGTWEQIKDRFLLGCGDKYSAGSTGGAETHTLTIDELPTHDHMQYWNAGDGNRNPSVLSKDKVGTGDVWGAFNHGEESYYQGKPLMTGEAGNGQPHNNMPPYLSVYIFKRVS